MNIILNPSFLRSLGLIFSSNFIIENTLKFYKLCTNINENSKHHILQSKHKFNDKCSIPCVIEVAEKIKKKLKVDDSETRLESSDI